MRWSEELRVLRAALWMHTHNLRFAALRSDFMQARVIVPASSGAGTTGAITPAKASDKMICFMVFASFPAFARFFCPFSHMPITVLCNIAQKQ